MPEDLGMNLSGCIAQVPFIVHIQLGHWYIVCKSTIGAFAYQMGRFAGQRLDLGQSPKVRNISREEIETQVRD